MHRLLCVPDMACRSASQVKIIHLSPREGEEGGVRGCERRVNRLPLIYRKELASGARLPTRGTEKKTALSD